MPRILVALVVVLGALTLTAAPAAAAEWSIGGKTMKELGLESESITSSGKAVKLNGTISGSPFSVTCNTSSGAGSKLIQTGKDEHVEIFELCEGEECEVVMVIVSNTRWIKIFGSTFVFDALVVSGGSAELSGCSVAGTYPFGGSTCSQTTMGEELVSQTLTFSAAIEETCVKAGEATGLKLGGKPATITGSVTSKLSGKNAGKKWRAT